MDNGLTEKKIAEQKSYIRRVSKGMVSDAENFSKDPETVLLELQNIKSKLIELRSTLPCTTTGGDFRL